MTTIDEVREICRALPECVMDIYLDTGEVDWDEVRELVTDAYRLVAPNKLAALVP